LVFAAFGAFVVVQKGYPARFSPAALAIADGAKDVNPLAESCDGKSATEILNGLVCAVGQPDAAPTFALIGDSYANALSPAVEVAAGRVGRRGIIMTRGGCYPLVGILSNLPCSDFINAAIARVRATPSIDTVVLVSRWTTAAEGSRFGAINWKRLFITDDESKNRTYDENKLVFARSLRRSAEALRGYKVLILAFVPEQYVNVPEAVALRMEFGLEDLGVPRVVVEARQAGVRKLLSAAESMYGFRILDAMPALCDAKKCRAIEHGRSLYSDDNHLSRLGAIREATLLAEALAPSDSLGGSR
jgi:hypothetical protein